MNKVFLSLFFSSVFLACTPKFTRILKSTDPEFKLVTADKYFTDKDYEKSKILYEDVFPFYKGTPKFEELYFKLAYTSYYLKDYFEAENLFKNFVSTFPNSSKAEEADFLRAYCFYKQSPKVDLDQSNTIKAIGQMQVFINTHPTSPRVQQANTIIDEGRAKLELKEERAAHLYFNLGYYRAAAISYSYMLENYPDSDKSEKYKLIAIKSYFLYAQNSIEEKQYERFEKVVNECNDFTERFPQSGFAKEVEEYKTQSLKFIKQNKR